MTIFIEEYEPASDRQKTYMVYFFDEAIHTTVTHDSATVTNWIAEIEEIHFRHLICLIVGVDVKCRTANRVATLQLCVGHRCLIYQLIHTLEIPESLVDFVSNNQYMFTGPEIGSNMEKLEQCYGIGNCDAVDVRFLAAREYRRDDLRNARLETLAGVILNQEMEEKPARVTRSRWDQRHLTEDQVMYACVDAFLSFKMGKILLYAYNSDSDD